MKAINIFTILLFVFFVSCSTTQKITIKISRDLSNKNISFLNSKRTKQFEKNAEYVRKKLLKKGYLSFLSQENIFFMIEGYDSETGDIFTSILNSKGEVEFIYNKRYYKIKKNLFSKELKKLVSNWNLGEITRLRQKRGVVLGALSMNILKISLKSNGEVKDIKRFNFLQYLGVMQSDMQLLKQ